MQHSERWTLRGTVRTTPTRRTWRPLATAAFLLCSVFDTQAERLPIKTYTTADGLCG